MHHRRIGAVVLSGSLLVLVAAGCGVIVEGGGTGGAGASGSGVASSSAADGDGALRWYRTCGDPVCRMHRDHPGVPACTTEKAGDPCASEGEACDPGDACNALLVCATRDPTRQPGGCPISRARFKHDIHTLKDAERARVHDDLVRMRLATWRYDHEGAAARSHLGFIIDDDPESPSVDASGDHVDLYGYTSMAVAAVQVQDAEIADQQQQLDALRREVEALRDEIRACRAAGRP